MKKVLVITDSLGLPRPTPEVILYNETWIYKLSQEFYVHQISIGGGTIVNLSSQIEYVKMFEPDYVFVQSGIVDCVPRALTEIESKILNNYKITRFLLKKTLRPKVLLFLRKNRNITQTEKYIFEEHVLKFLSSFSSKLYWIGIVPASKEYEHSIPGISKNIINFNSIIKKHLKNNFIELIEFTQIHTLSDQIHLSKEGHDALLNKVKSILK